MVRKKSFQILQRLNFFSGSIVGVIGVNASGKSTLFKRITGFLPGGGKVMLNNQRHTKVTRDVVYMPQDTNMRTSLSVYEVILLARKQDKSWLLVSKSDLQAVDQIIEDLDISALSCQSVNELSGGQRQMVAVAQALVRNPEVLQYTDMTLLIHGGTLTACGPSNKIMNAEILRDVYGVNARIEPCSCGVHRVIRRWPHCLSNG